MGCLTEVLVIETSGGTSVHVETFVKVPYHPTEVFAIHFKTQRRSV